MEDAEAESMPWAHREKRLQVPEAQAGAGQSTGQRDRFARSGDGYTWDSRCPVTRMLPLMQN